MAVDFTEEDTVFVGAMIPQFTSLKVLIVPEPAYIRSSKIAHRRQKIEQDVLRTFHEYYQDMHGRTADECPHIYFVKRHAFETMRNDTKVTVVESLFAAHFP